MGKFEAVQVQHVEVKEISLEDYISKGMELREKKDNIQWEMGDLAHEVTEKFGAKYLAEFSKGIGVEASTLRRYRDVARAYTKEIREEFKFLPWSSFRQLAGQPDRVEWLKKAHDNSWSSEKLAQMLKPNAIQEGEGEAPVTPRPELHYDKNCRKWYILDGEGCPSQGQCMEVK